MGRIVPENIKPRFEQKPAGLIQLKIEDAQEGYVGKEGSEVYGIMLQQTVEAPEEAVGVSCDRTFFIGITADAPQVQRGKLAADPDANEPATWQSRGAELKEVCDACGVTFEGQDIEVVLSELKGRSYVCQTKQKHEAAFRRSGQPNDNAGMVRVDYGKSFAVGAQPGELHVEEPLSPLTPAEMGGAATPAGRPPLAAVPGSKPGPKPMPTAARPAAAAPAARPAAAAARTPVTRLGR